MNITCGVLHTEPLTVTLPPKINSSLLLLDATNYTVNNRLTHHIHVCAVYMRMQ